MKGSTRTSIVHSFSPTKPRTSWSNVESWIAHIYRAKSACSQPSTKPTTPGRLVHLPVTVKGIP